MAATLPLEYAAITIVKAATFILFSIDAYGDFFFSVFFPDIRTGGIFVFIGQTIIVLLGSSLHPSAGLSCSCPADRMKG